LEAATKMKTAERLVRKVLSCLLHPRHQIWLEHILTISSNDDLPDWDVPGTSFVIHNAYETTILQRMQYMKKSQGNDARNKLPQSEWSAI